MANRSYLYACNNLSEVNNNKEPELLGISEFKYDIPLAYKIMLSGELNLGKSIIWENQGDLAIYSNFALGVKKLTQFLQSIKSLNKQEIDRVLSFLKDEAHQREFFILECGEIFDMHDVKLEEQAARLYKEIAEVDTEIELFLSKVNVEKQSFIKTTIRPLFSSAKYKKALSADEIFQHLGLTSFSSVLCFAPSASKLTEQKKPNGETQFLLALLYTEEAQGTENVKVESIKRSWELAAKWHQIAIELGHPLAYRNLAQIYLDGNISKPDQEKAVDLLEKGGKAGDSNALSTLSKMYQTGLLASKTGSEAYDLLVQSVEIGDPNATFNLAHMYHDGKFTKQCIHKALSLYLQAAENGVKKAYVTLGNTYFIGDGVDIDYEKATEYYKQGAEKNDPEASERLGTCYLNGVGIKKSVSFGEKYIRLAAEKGYAPAQSNLGVMYQQGIGVNVNFETAQYWLEKSAAQDFAPALYAMAHAMLGHKVNGSSKSKAIQLLEKACSIGHETSCQALVEIKNKN